MGEARRRRNARLDQLRAVQPYCVYCGGSTPGTTVDHMPPKVIFDQRLRPKGLEFLACEACNSGSRISDLVAGLMSRMYPDVSPGSGAEIGRLFAAVGNNVPGLLQELRPTASQRVKFGRHRDHLPANARPLVANGPITTRMMQGFAAKLGLALHFWHTQLVVPASGAVAIRWYTNFESMTRTVAPDLLALLGPPETLRQGSFEVRDQFQFASVSTPDGAMSAHFASFRVSFAVSAFAVVDASRASMAPESNLYRPGFFKDADDTQRRHDPP